jgi:hypothetical protein
MIMESAGRRLPQVGEPAHSIRAIKPGMALNRACQNDAAPLSLRGACLRADGDCSNELRRRQTQSCMLIQFLEFSCDPIWKRLH